MTVANKILLRRCATCDVHYEHGEGGACLSCGRVFCAKHLHGPIANVLRFLRKDRPVCRECRKARH